MSFKTIQEIKKEYLGKIDPLDLDLIIANVMGESRELVLMHPETLINKEQEKKIEKFIKRRLKNEPLAYILEHKEFMELDFKVDKSTLIPRPETELLVEKVLKDISASKKHYDLKILDVGTGSGNIIISLANNIVHKTHNKKIKFFSSDISKKSLGVAL